MEKGEDVYFDLNRAETAGEIPSAPMKPATRTVHDDGDDSHSTASTAPSTSPSSSSREENDDTNDDDTASIMSNESWSDVAVGQDSLVDTNTPMAPLGTATTATTTQVNEGNFCRIDENHIIIKRQSKSVSTLNLDEATAVLALFEMAKPEKQIAASTYSEV